MPWKKEATVLKLRKEFVNLATRENANMSRLCRRFNISRKTGYKWVRRWKAEGAPGLIDRSRRPANSPNKRYWIPNKPTPNGEPGNSGTNPSGD